MVRQYPALGDPTLTGFGYKMWFFNSIHGRAATGFLEERLKNQRKILAKKKAASLAPASKDVPGLKWDSEDEEGGS